MIGWPWSDPSLGRRTSASIMWAVPVQIKEVNTYKRGTAEDARPLRKIKGVWYLQICSDIF